MTDIPTIIYTHTDEAPALATYSFLPIITAFTEPAGVRIETRDISLSGRIIAHFPERMTPEQRIEDHLTSRTHHQDPGRQHHVASEHQRLRAPAQGGDRRAAGRGYDLPDTEEPSNDEERMIKATYDKVKGSAVNPVLREGNSDRRAPRGQGVRAEQSPPDGRLVSGLEVPRGHDVGRRLPLQRTIRDRHRPHHRTDRARGFGRHGHGHEGRPRGRGRRGRRQHLQEPTGLVDVLEEQITDAAEQGILFSLHMKATMMKVSDPIIFGHAVRVYFKDVFEKHADTFKELGVDVNNGFGDLLSRIATLPDARRSAIEADIQAAYDAPDMAMVDSDRGITNLHVPSDIIIDASMPVVVRDSGRCGTPPANCRTRSR